MITNLEQDQMAEYYQTDSAPKMSNGPNKQLGKWSARTHEKAKYNHESSELMASIAPLKPTSTSFDCPDQAQTDSE